MNRKTLLRSLLVTAFFVAAVTVTVFALRGHYVGVRQGKADANYLKSNDCRVCHEDHYASWRRTHHSRMTQDASPATVQGDFTAQNTLEYMGVKARMERRDAGFFMS